MFIISTVVLVQFLHNIVVSAMERTLCTLNNYSVYKQEARMDSGEVTSGSKRFIYCLASVQLSCHRVSAELMRRCCLGVFSQIFQRCLGVFSQMFP